VWVAKNPCRIVLHRSDILRLLDTSRFIGDSVILASLNALEARNSDVYFVDPINIEEKIRKWPKKTARAKMMKKDLSTDAFKVRSREAESEHLANQNRQSPSSSSLETLCETRSLSTSVTGRLLS
jgi:hypothetical protein